MAKTYKIYWRNPTTLTWTTSGVEYPTPQAAWDEVYKGLQAEFGMNPKGDRLREYKKQVNNYSVR